MFFSSKILYSNKIEERLAIEKFFHSLNASVELFNVFSIVLSEAFEIVEITLPLDGLKISMGAPESCIDFPLTI